MLSKAKLKELAVYKQQKHCDEAGVFVVEGVKMCEEALAANLPIRTVCATISWLSAHGTLPLSAEVFEADQSMLERLSGLRTPNEVWMVVERRAVRPRGGSRLTIALDHVQDPGNLGTIIRTADWFGVREIVCSEGTVSCYNPKAAQATMGSLFRTSVRYGDLPAYLSECGRPVFGALLDGVPIWGGSPLALPAEGAVLVIGNESRGLTEEVRRRVTHPIAIPNIGGTAESLNASVACGILLAELCRKE